MASQCIPDGLRGLQDATADRIAHPHLRALWQHWTNLRGRQVMPRKDRFDILDLPAEVWPRVFLFDLLPEAGRFRLRVLGTYMVDAYGRDFTGRMLEETDLPGISRTAIYRMLTRLAATAEPQHYAGPTSFRFQDGYTEVEQVLLPLCAPDGRLAHAVGAADFPGYEFGMPWRT